jgi:aromatic ring-opening dioxygenase catalytic subunit (LigB family)
MDGAMQPMFKNMDKNSACAHFLSELPKLTEAPPKAIVIVSAHWEESVFTVNSFTEGTPLTYDYYGFPKDAYAPHLLWPAKSSGELQGRVLGLLQDEFGTSGAAMSNSSRGFDHGVFVPMKVAFPVPGDMPFVQVSCRADLDIDAHLRLGKALSSLLNEGIWVIASGSTTHNLQEIGASDGKWASEFADWMSKTVLSINDNLQEAKVKLVQTMRLAPHASRAHARAEHLIPLFVAIGAGMAQSEAGAGGTWRKAFSQMVAGTLSLDSYVFH